MGPGVRRWLAAAAIALLAVGGVWQFGLGAWIPIKAVLAQVLPEQAWQRTLAGERRVRPWPWADTWPVAALDVAGERLIMLADRGGHALAFGPGHVTGSAAPGAADLSVLAGHRDTHFRQLRALSRGSTITLTTADGQRRLYVVRESRVLPHPELAPPPLAAGASWLALAACWPFDALRVGGEERFVILASPLEWPDPVHDSATVEGTIDPPDKGGVT